MNMLNAKLDTKHFSKTMKNTIAYSMGFVDGIELNKINFNKELAQFTKEALGKYIDAKARGNPKKLHHVYEPGMTGSENGRLYEFDAIPTRDSIILNGSFKPSTKTPLNGGDPFTNRAEIMENGIAITIVPKNANFLVFEYEGETVFTSKAIYIAHPGGDQVAGSFGEVVDDFFNNYFTNAMLGPLLKKLQNPKEFVNNFSAGAAGGGRGLGIKAGKSYLDVIGVIE